LHRNIDQPIYDKVFRSYFLSDNGPLQHMLKMKVHLDPEAETEFEVLTQPEAGQEKQFDAPSGLMGSNMEVLRRKRFAVMTDEEKAALRKLMQKFKFLPLKRRTRRTVANERGMRPGIRTCRTRITQLMQTRKPVLAYEAAAKAVFDWEGGTRIGEALVKFVYKWGPRVMSRGAIVLRCSDGVDRGDPAVLAEAMDRLS